MGKNYIYADGVERVTMLEGVVRLELYCCSGRDAEGNSLHEETGQLVMPPAAFLRAYDAMGEFVRLMEEKGLVARKAATPAPPRSGRSDHSSPNFD